MICFYFIIGNSQKRKVSFYARLMKNVGLGRTQTVIFDEVVTNNGHGYNKHTGHFLAPRDGTYYFAAIFLCVRGSTHLQMMKNDQEIGRGVGYHDHANTGVINVIVNLKKGDVVFLRHSEDVGGQRETIHGNRYSELVGHML
jgi:hypothetical protein